MCKLPIVTFMVSWCISASRCRYTLSAGVFRREIAELVTKMVVVIFGANSCFHRRFQRIIRPQTSTAHSMTVERTVATRRRS